MPALESILLRVIKDPSFMRIVRLQHDKDVPDLEAMCKRCADWCKQDADFRVLVQEALCKQIIKGVRPDEDAAKERKLAGSALFREGKYQQAATLYTGSLAMVDETTSSGKAMATDVYCNRSLALLQMTPPNAQAALQDACCAIECSPKHSKAWYRKACALEHLHQHAAAADSAERALKAASPEQQAECLRLLQQLKLKSNDSTRASHQQQQGHAFDMTPIEPDTFQPPPPWPRQGSTQRHKGTSSHTEGLAMETKQREGRQLVTTFAVPAGTTLFSEKPYAHALQRSQMSKRCHTCLRPVQPHLAYTCKACQLARYCSSTCRSQDQFHKPHGMECGSPWVDVLSYGKLYVVLASRVARRLMQDKSPCAQFITTLDMHFQKQMDTLPIHVMEHTFMAVLAVECCRLTQPNSASIPPASSVLAALLRVHYNSIAVVPQQHASDADRIALALYPTASLMNHSCLPNVALAFDGEIMTARATEALQPGNAVLHCYGVQRGAEITPVRQRLMQQEYHFECQCSACMRGLDESERDMISLRCLNRQCPGSVLPSQGLEAWLTSKHDVPAGLGNNICTLCFNDWSLELSDPQHMVWKGLATGRDDFLPGARKGLQAFQTAAPAEAEAAAREAMFRLMRLRIIYDSRLGPCNQLKGWMYDKMAGLAVFLGNHDLALDYALKTLSSMAAYPPNSTAVAYQKLKLSQLAETAEDPAAARWRCEAMEALTFHWGDSISTECYPEA